MQSKIILNRAIIAPTEKINGGKSSFNHKICSLADWPVF